MLEKPHARLSLGITLLPLLSATKASFVADVSNVSDAIEAQVAQGLHRVRMSASVRQRPPARFGLLITGRASGYGISATAALKRRSLKPYERTSISAIFFAARSHREFILGLNRMYGVDVFVHSWNPEAAGLIDAQYGDHLALSLHEAPPLTGAPSPSTRVVFSLSCC